MKKCLKSFALILGLVASLQVGAFASTSPKYDGELSNKPKTHDVSKKICRFTGHFKVTDDSLQEIRTNMKDTLKELDFPKELDLNLNDIKLDIRPDGHGKISLLFNIKTDSNKGVNIYSNVVLVFDISQKDGDTFEFGLESDKCEFTLSKRLINKKKCIVFESKNECEDLSKCDLAPRIVFERTK